MSLRSTPKMKILLFGYEQVHEEIEATLGRGMKPVRVLCVGSLFD